MPDVNRLAYRRDSIWGYYLSVFRWFNKVLSELSDLICRCIQSFCLGSAAFPAGIYPTGHINPPGIGLHFSDAPDQTSVSGLEGARYRLFRYLESCTTMEP